MESADEVLKTLIGYKKQITEMYEKMSAIMVHRRTLEPSLDDNQMLLEGHMIVVSLTTDNLQRLITEYRTASNRDAQTDINLIARVLKQMLNAEKSFDFFNDLLI